MDIDVKFINMSYINLVMALPDFFRYIEDILEKERGVFLMEQKDKKGNISIKEIALGSLHSGIENDRGQYLGFFILSTHVDGIKRSMLYDDEFAPVVITGEGGRVSPDSIERISLRLLSKKPDKNTKRIFNAIKSRLKKDPNIGIGVEGGSKFHDDYFYQAEHVNRKVFKTDFYNDKAPVITVKS